MDETSRCIVGRASVPPGDRRAVSANVSGLGPLRDKRGCPRYRINDEGAVELVPVADRTPDVKAIGDLWFEWATLRAAYLATRGEVDARPALKAEVLRRIDEIKAQLDELVRAGRQEDEP